MKNPDAIGWKIPVLYGDDLLLVPVPNDAPGEEGEGALEIGAADTIGGAAAHLNREQVEQLIADLCDYLRPSDNAEAAIGQAMSD